MRLTALALLASCAPPVPPSAPRAPDSQQAAVVELTVECDPFPDDTWSPFSIARASTGVLVSPRHILTAAHAVECAAIPVVHATMPGGRRMRVVVERDDLMFGSGLDLALLVAASDEDLAPGLAPPRIPTHVAWGRWCAATRRGPSCGDAILPDWFAGSTRDADSGAGVYDPDGALAGVVVGRGSCDTTKIQPVPAGWLRGL